MSHHQKRRVREVEDKNTHTQRRFTARAAAAAADEEPFLFARAIFFFFFLISTSKWRNKNVRSTFDCIKLDEKKKQKWNRHTHTKLPEHFFFLATTIVGRNKCICVLEYSRMERSRAGPGTLLRKLTVILPAGHPDFFVVTFFGSAAPICSGHQQCDSEKKNCGGTHKNSTLTRWR